MLPKIKLSQKLSDNRLALVKLFEIGKISSGKVAQILGITRIAFFDVLAKYGVDIYNDSSEESLKEDINNA
ncbi:MAG: Fis family transcriptional regulator [Flexibacter sp. CG_4_10_14_3_um_filter_32_15]|nr:MAG: Fis family transcriptional regulator [Flexibacter sp. CG_4_10_14_3_um_filter_32_15]